MDDKAEQPSSGLPAWASEVMPGGDTAAPLALNDAVDRGAGPVRHDPADVISVFMSAHESARERNAQARRDAAAQARGRSQPS